MFAYAIVVLVTGLTIALLRRPPASPGAVSRTWRAWLTLEPSSRTWLAVLLIAFAMIHASHWYMVLRAGGAGPLAALVVSTLLPWCVAVLVFAPPLNPTQTTSQIEPGSAPGRRADWSLLGLMVFASTASAAWSLWRSNAHALHIDEGLYLFQANLFRHGSLAMRIRPGSEPFFAVRQAVVAGAGIHSQYPPGWPGMLAVWSAVAPPWLLVPALAGLLPAATLRIGKLLYSERVGIIAAAFVATCGGILWWSASIMSDVPTTTLLAGAAAVGATGVVSHSETRRVGCGLGAGLLAGLAFAIRPLTAVSMAPLIVVVVGLADHRATGTLWRTGKTIALVVAGAAPVLALTFWFNWATNGSALVFGYTRANPGLHELGFGLRGFVDYSDLGVAVITAEPFRLRDALVMTARQLAAFDQISLGGFFLPLFAIGIVRRSLPRNAWLLVASAAVLPFVHLFWFYTDVRYYLPLVPFLAVVAAASIAGSADTSSKLERRTCLAIVIANLAFAVSGTILDGFWSNPLTRSRTVVAQVDAVDALRRGADSVVVFVFDPGVHHTDLWRLYSLNSEGDKRRPIVVARDLGVKNDELLRTLPGWVAACLTASQPAKVHMIPAGSPPTCR